MPRYSLPYILAVLALSVALYCAISPSFAEADPCHEDRPCWTWPTMGDHKRGLYVHGRKARVIVGPCGYARLQRRDRIDWTRTLPLRGDHWAYRYGCKR